MGHLIVGAVSFVAAFAAFAAGFATCWIYRSIVSALLAEREQLKAAANNIVSKS